MRKLFFALTLSLQFLIIVACTHLVSKNEEQAQLHLRIAMGHLQKESYPLALSELIKAHELDPENPLIENNLGLAYFYRERIDLAEKHLRKSLELDPKYTDARINLAHILIEKTSYEEAFTVAQKASLDLTYNQPQRSFMYMGIALFKKNQFTQAQKYLLKSIELQRDNCLSQNYYGRTHLEMNNYKAASQALDTAAGYCLSSQFDEPQYYSGLSYFQLGDTQKAVDRLETLLKIYPQGQYLEKAKALLTKIKR